MRTIIGRRPLLGAAGSALLLALGGCVYDGYYDDGYYYDGYYDEYYGPYAGGYWAVDGFFYYWLRDRYHRDDHRHFRREHFPGAHPFRGDRDGPHRRSGSSPQGDQPPPPHHPPGRRRPRGDQPPPHPGDS